MTHAQETSRGSLSELLDHGRDMLQAGDAEKAIEIFQKATQTHPRNSKAWNDLGVALHATQKPNLAIDAFKMAILMDSGHVDAALNLSIFHYNRGRAIDGFSVLREAYRKNPTSKELRLEMLDQGLLAWKPLALIWKGGDHEVVHYAQKALRQAGFMVNSPENPIVAACSPMLRVQRAAWVRYFRQVEPRVFLIPPGARVDQEALDAARSVGVPVHHMADFLPEKGWDANLEEVEESLKAILQETPSAPKRDQSPDPLITVVVTANRTDVDCGGVLDRLALQDMEPGLFEVLVVDGGTRPTLQKKIEPSHFPYHCKMFRSDAEGLFAARDLAIEEARGKWIFYFSQAERPGPRCLRRMLRERLSEHAPSLGMDVQETSSAPAGKFWQHQLRQTIREEVGQLIDQKLNTVEFGLQLQQMMMSADFVRTTFDHAPRGTTKELMDSLSDHIPEHGQCLAFGRDESQWLHLLAERLERPMEGFQTALTTADAIVEETSVSNQAEGSESVHWAAGVLSLTLPMAAGVQNTPIAFLTFDRCPLDAVDFALGSVKHGIQSGTVILVREDPRSEKQASATHETVVNTLEEQGLSYAVIGTATDEKSCVYALRVT